MYCKIRQKKFEKNFRYIVPRQNYFKLCLESITVLLHIRFDAAVSGTSTTIKKEVVYPERSGLATSIRSALVLTLYE